MKTLRYLVLMLLLLTSTRALAQTNGAFVRAPGLAVSPHAAWGGGWSTTIYVTCIDGANFTMKFWDKNRLPLRVPVKTYSGLSGSVEQVSRSMQHREVEIITLSSPESQISTGWVSIDIASSSQGQLQIYEVFRFTAAGRPDLEAAIPFIVPTENSFARYFPYDHRENSETGFAVVKGPPASGSPNYNDPATTVRIYCYENRIQIWEGEVPLRSGDVYGAWLLTSIVPATAGKVGYCLLAYASGGQGQPFLNVTAFKFAPGGSFTTVPIGTNN